MQGGLEALSPASAPEAGATDDPLRRRTGWWGQSWSIRDEASPETEVWPGLGPGSKRKVFAFVFVLFVVGERVCAHTCTLIHTCHTHAAAQSLL